MSSRTAPRHTPRPALASRPGARQSSDGLRAGRAGPAASVQCACTRERSYPHTRLHTHLYTRAHMNAPTPARTHTCEHSYTHARSRTHTHTHTRVLGVGPGTAPATLRPVCVDRDRRVGEQARACPQSGAEAGAACDLPPLSSVGTWPARGCAHSWSRRGLSRRSSTRTSR